ncbi:hypothetical protein BKA65DRAFT_189029 [Rhexocercosporidium sp. MPI-PUGE-AT-0058]|nr:hypothetical protein BKA65DRAFT_189029 [Rhexocercosporidium sp. MPI-PUGE-AT-0058]
MDAREREASQSRRPSIKRPWEEDYALPQQVNVWSGTRLPPIDASSYRRPSLPPRVTEPEDIWGNHYGSESRDGGAKRARFEGNDYNSFSPEELALKGDVLRPLGTHSNYTPNRISQELPSSRLHQDQGRGTTELGGSENVSLTKACPSCKELIMQGSLGDENNDSAEVLKASAGLLNNTVLVLTRFMPEAQGVIREGARIDPSLTADCPPIEEAGLKHTLDWLLDRIQHVNDLAEKLMQHVPPGSSQGIERNSTKDGTSVQDGLGNIMKRRMNADSGDTYRPRDDREEAITDARLHTRQPSIATTLPGTEEFLSMRNSQEHHPLNSALHSGPNQRVLMNPPPPPPAPNRQLPSPPGRSLHSPTSLNFPSPSTSSYGSSSQPSSHLPPSGLHHSSLSSYLPPIGPAHSPDALQAHTAALQHEVSVQKIALSSLQGEHNKLLAAFSRSQTRASALEKKHSVSDTEIISLTEEKLRLQTQVGELERDVEELARSRDEFRQAAVQEGAQYVEIVKRASRLEEVAGEERKAWNKMKLEMEQKIDALSDGSSRMDQAPSTFPRLVDDVNTPASSIDVQNDLKMENTSDSRPTSHPKIALRDSNHELEEEIRRLRNRCAEVESALRAVREESRRMEGIIEALGLAGKSILERADRTLSGS